MWPVIWQTDVHKLDAGRPKVLMSCVDKKKMDDHVLNVNQGMNTQKIKPALKKYIALSTISGCRLSARSNRGPYKSRRAYRSFHLRKEKIVVYMEMGDACDIS